MNALEAWRKQENQHNFHFPDSRDPIFQKISQTEKITTQDFEKAVVAVCCWRENREDGYYGQIAIGHVINNRAKAGWFGGNQYMNVVAKDQFSSMTIPDDPQLDKYPLESDTEFQKVLANIDALFENELLDRTGGALYYADLSFIQENGWFQREIIDKPNEHERLAVIGRTTFFK